jgi:hypothetical protein
MRGVSFPLAPIIGDGALETRKIDKFLLFNNQATRQFRRITMSTSRPVTTQKSIGLERDAAGPQVLKNRLHKFTDEENRMQPIAAGRCCRRAGLRGRGTPVNRIMELADP